MLVCFFRRFINSIKMIRAVIHGNRIKGIIVSTVCLSGMLLGEIVKNLSKMAVPDPKQQLKMMMLSAVS